MSVEPSRACAPSAPSEASDGRLRYVPPQYLVTRRGRYRLHTGYWVARSVTFEQGRWVWRLTTHATAAAARRALDG